MSKTSPPSRGASVRRLTVTALLVAVAFVLSYLEAILPFSIGVPGVKLGLCHVAVMFALYRLGRGHALLVTAVRVLLAAVLFGNAATLAYSLCGALLSLAVMLILHRVGVFSPLGVSIAGAVTHNFGQLAVAALLMQTVSLGWYLPVLLLAGCISGTVIGLLAVLCVRRVPPF